MCGIVGIIDGAVSDSASAMRGLRDAMARRGPDGVGEHVEGPIALGHRRLSVIDLAGGWQPLISAQGSVVAFQNGEIYNFRSLRAELERGGRAFRTASDTEVIAHGYAEWGIDGLLDRLDGMFAIAILDRRSRRLHLARDRFGEKPLFYAGDGARFAFASAMDALAALPWVDAQPDAVALHRYFALHFVPGRRTAVRGISRVLPGERLEIDIDRPVPIATRYYRCAPAGTTCSDDRLAGLIEGAVESRLVADVPVGVFLSGGLDSSIVASIAAAKLPRIATFSMGFSDADHDESGYAAAIAERIGSTHHRFRFDSDSFATLLPQVVDALDEPIGDQAALPLFWLCREARRHVTVVLAGEGADEIFAGYGYYATVSGRATLKRRIAEALGLRPRPARLASLIGDPSLMAPSGFPLLTTCAERSRLLGQAPPAPDAWEAELMDRLDRCADPLLRATTADLLTWLPDDLLVKFDRMAMAHGLEGRAPFLQRDLVEAAMGLSPDQRLRGSATKIALRRVARRWLPERILERRKQGFVLPMAAWIEAWLAERGDAAAYFDSAHVPGVDPIELAALVGRDLATRVRLALAAIVLCEWWRAFSRRVAALRERALASTAR